MIVIKYFYLIPLLLIIPKASSSKYCAEIEFCANFRSREPQDKYIASFLSSDSNSVLLNLADNDGSDSAEDNLLLKLTAIKGSIFRLEISEINSTRYQLTDVLDGEPDLEQITAVEEGADNATVTVHDKVVIINYSPVSIKFINNDVEQISLDGNRLILENSESSQAFAFSVLFQQALRAYGLHEHALPLPLQDTGPDGLDPYRLRNIGNGAASLHNTEAMYGCVPTLYGHGPNSTAGVFLHNAAQLFVDINTNKDNVSGTEAYFMAESASFDLFLLLGPTPEAVVAQYKNVTGVPHMPQLWTLGYHQSRYTYDNQEDVKDVIANFDIHNFPVDSIWLDIDYTDGKRYFTWNPDTFSDPIEMQANLSSTNRKLVVIVDPHVKIDEDYWVYSEALKQGFFVNNSDGSVYEADCFPGASHYADFLNPEARNYFESLYSYDNFANTTPTLAGIWNDMNEPRVFDDNTDGTFPNDIVHYGNVLHRDSHNIYGFLQAMSTHHGLINRDNGEIRPFVLTRSHFAGVQRYAGMWTGDCGSDWPFLSVSISMCLNANIMGINLCGSDIGGFTGNPSEELLQRWYQTGAWLPFFRSHSTKEVDRREPYLYSEDVQTVIRDAIKMRYQHLPQWYTLYFESIRFKSPLIRPLFYQYPDDIDGFDVDNEILLGRDILVRPVIEEGADSIEVYFPGNEEELWINLETNSVYNGGQTVVFYVDIHSVPVFYRVGSIIARKDNVRSTTTDMVADGHTFYVFLDKESTAHGTIYLDDGVSFNYKNNLEYSYIGIHVVDKDISLTAIDDSADFELKIEGFIFFQVKRLPCNGKPGVAKKIRYMKDIHGNLISEMIFKNLTERVVLNLK